MEKVVWLYIKNDANRFYIMNQAHCFSSNGELSVPAPLCNERLRIINTSKEEPAERRVTQGTLLLKIVGSLYGRIALQGELL